MTIWFDEATKNHQRNSCQLLDKQKEILQAMSFL